MASTAAYRMRIARLLIRLTMASLTAALLRPWRALAAMFAAAPERLLIAPQDIRTADPTIASDIYSGYFAFASRIVDTHGRSPFDIQDVPPEWEAVLCGFGWLRHLRGADTALARANARALVADWIALQGRRRDKIAWQPEIAARRLISWLSQSPLILEGADRGFYRRFMKSLGRHAGFLERIVAENPESDSRLLELVALALLGLCAGNMAALQRRSTRQLTAELTRAILPDGGHISRNPQRLIDLLADLLPLRQAYAARSIEVPSQLLNSIDRMMPMVRLFRHGDGALALFNGMAVTAPDILATILAYDDARARPLINAPYSGYQRLEAEGTLVILEAGRPPPPAFSRRAHAGTLSFEFSVDHERIVVNCGVPGVPSAEIREAARSTAAHSTLTVGDASSARFAAAKGWSWFLGGEIVAGPRTVEGQRQESAASTAIEASHDGYASRFGLIHRRRIELASDGAQLIGEDRVVPIRGRQSETAPDCVIRFHLHPNVRADRLDDGTSVLIRLASGRRWLFESRDATLELEESIFFALPDGPRKTDQIALYADPRGEAGVAWSFSRLDD